VIVQAADEDRFLYALGLVEGHPAVPLGGNAFHVADGALAALRPAVDAGYVTVDVPITDQPAPTRARGRRKAQEE
jgi:hypothetical protein